MKKILLVVPVLLIMLTAAALRAEQKVNPRAVTDIKQAFLKGALVVKGEGAAPAEKSLTQAQKRILALRAAKVVALREAAEIIDGVSINGETTVMNASAQSDTIKSAVQGVIKGAQVIKEGYDPITETAAVFVSVPMTGPNSLMAQLLPDLMPMLPEAPVYQTPLDGAQPGNYDGLIIDVTNHSFRPALINRVLTRSGEIIYDPSMVAQDILVERGAAEYTNNIGKAKALLSERGSVNPAVVKAAGLVKSTDVEVSAEDATAVFSSNQSANFLEGAKVVFVLK